MPDIVAHNSMGDKVMSRLPQEISSTIDRNIFRFSVMGPDPYIFYRFFLRRLRHGVNKRSHTMHRTDSKKFLLELAKRNKTTEMFSFLAGFLCHFALDSTSHPYIFGKGEYKSNMHTAIEHKLDVIELEKQGKQRRDLMKLFVMFPDLPEVREAMKYVYGWDDDYYKTGYRHMKLYHWFVKDQSGILNAVLGKRKGNFGAISYRNHLCDDMDLSPFVELEKKAVKFGVEIITAAYKFRAGEINEEEFGALIGDRNYPGEVMTS